MKTNQVFSEKELRKFNWRWIFESQIGWNYERMQGLGYLSTMVPVIEKLYGDNPELKKKALKAHSQFFNTEPNMGNVVVGMDIAIEEEARDEQGIEVAASIKTALMGPFAGIGDTIFGMIAGAVFGSIAASMAIEKSPIGIIIWLLWNAFLLFFLRHKLFDLGYTQGAKLVTTMGKKMNALTDAAGVLGLMVVGCIIATMVKFPLDSVVINLDKSANLVKEFPLQTYADSIMPNLMPAALAGLCYWLLGKKWMNSNRLILAVIIFAIVFSACGLLKV